MKDILYFGLVIFLILVVIIGAIVLLTNARNSSVVMNSDNVNYSLIEIEGMPCIWVEYNTGDGYGGLSCDWSKYGSGR